MDHDFDVVYTRLSRSARLDIMQDTRARILILEAFKRALVGDRIGAASLADNAVLAVDDDPWRIELSGAPLDMSILEG